MTTRNGDGIDLIGGLSIDAAPEKRRKAQQFRGVPIKMTHRQQWRESLAA
jgi:hypothetical protein